MKIFYYYWHDSYEKIDVLVPLPIWTIVLTAIPIFVLKNGGSCCAIKLPVFCGEENAKWPKMHLQTCTCKQNHTNDHCKWVGQTNFQVFLF